MRTFPSRAQPASAPPCVLALLSVLVSRAAWASVGGRHSLARALQNETRGIRRQSISSLCWHPTVRRLDEFHVRHRSPKGGCTHGKYTEVNTLYTLNTTPYK